MAVQLDPSGKDDLKTQFITREGEYRLMTLSEYSRPNRVGYQNNQNSPQVRVSLVSLPPPPITTQPGLQQSQQGSSNNGLDHLNSPSVNATESNLITPGCSTSIGGDRICFNYGKELYVYAYRGVKKAADLSKPIDKKLYKGTNPSCHDFNATTATYIGAPLLVGFSTGQIQLVQPGRREQGKLYNEERLIDKTKVTCLKWVPGSENLFLASHSSGNLYVYNDELPCSPTTPSYQPFKCGDGYMVLTCKSKSTRNPLYKWCFGQQENSSINEFCFSPCGQNLAIVSQDGFLRVFHYTSMDLLGIARSYFGGFLCVCWSPDGKYVVVGGEDDLVTVYSLNERRVVARGQGHRSWVSVVAFDPYTTSYSNWDGGDFSDDENPINDGGYRTCFNHINHNGDTSNLITTVTTMRRPTSSSTCRDSISNSDKLATSYRLGSVSQDTQLCLWDITEDVLRQSLGHRTRTLSSNDPTTVNLASELSNNSANNSNSGQPTANIDTKPVAGSSSTSDHDTVDNFNVKQININLINSSLGNSKLTNTVTTTINCDDSNNSNNGSDKDIICNNIDSKHLNNHSITSNSVAIGVEKTTASSTTSTSTTNKKDKDNSSEKLIISGNSSKSSSDISSSNQHQHHHHSAFNTLTQRLSNFSFGNNSSGSSSNSDKGDKYEKSSKLSSSNKRNFITLSSNKSNNNSHHNSNHNHYPNNVIMHNHLNNNVDATTTSSGSSGGGGGGGISTITSIMTSSLTKSKHNSTGLNSNSIVSSYDPMKLIGTPACPRFDDCPVLEPLVCKKIAHERLTALIFREDCFLTACQDGFVYTWARPGYINIPQHMPPSPTAPPGGTVV